jgi:hypothetical protein
LIALAGCQRDLENYNSAHDLLNEAEELLLKRYDPTHLLLSNLYNAKGLLNKA